MPKEELFTSKEQVMEAMQELKGEKGDSLVEGILTRIRQEHELSAAERKRALDEAMAALPKEVLDMKWSDFKNAGYPTTAEELAGENQNPNGA